MPPGRGRYTVGRRGSPGRGAHAYQRGGGFNPAAVFFDGTNDAFRFRNGGSALATRGNKSGWITSFWIYFTNFTLSGQPIGVALFSEPGGGGDNAHQLSSTSAEQVWGGLKENSPLTTIYNAALGPNGQDDGEWHHYLWADWRGSATVSENSHALVIDNAQVWSFSNLAQVGPGWDTDSIPAWYWGKAYATDQVIQDCHMAEIFVATLDSYFDITSEANLRKFITADGKPANLGADGSTPLGYQPEIYITGTDASDWENVGTIGTIETVYGALTDSDKLPVARP